ncbi:MAG: ArsR family transcriptional regulator [Chlorobi bacterium]|nr:ArsR family transcriptional regulator [Chlorobiota bacterium]
MIESIITSKTRVKLLLKFFLNNKTQSYLRNLEAEFGENSNAIRVELNRLENAGLLTSAFAGNKKMYMANITHPLYNDIHNIMYKMVGIDQVIERVTSQIGELEAAYLTGSFAQGRNSKIIDLALVGEYMDRDYINKLVRKVEQLINRKIRTIILSGNELKDYFGDTSILLIWKKDKIEKVSQA